MNNPCGHCNTADKEKQGYFKCENPCSQAKACYKSDKKMVEIFGDTLSDAIRKGGKGNGI